MISRYLISLFIVYVMQETVEARSETDRAIVE
jgi:hypothetical protein